MLHGCLVACQKFFQVYLAIPTENLVGHSMVDFGRMSHALATLFKLSLLELPGWTLEHVQQIANISVIMGELIQKLESTLQPIANYTPGTEPNDAFNQGARRLRGVKEWLDTKFAMAGSGFERQQQQGMELSALGLEAFDMGNPFCFLNEASWQEIMESLERDSMSLDPQY